MRHDEAARTAAAIALERRWNSPGEQPALTTEDEGTRSAGTPRSLPHCLPYCLLVLALAACGTGGRAGHPRARADLDARADADLDGGAVAEAAAGAAHAARRRGAATTS